MFNEFVGFARRRFRAWAGSYTPAKVRLDIQGIQQDIDSLKHQSRQTLLLVQALCQHFGVEISHADTILESAVNPTAADIDAVRGEFVDLKDQ